jgi:hypothetical protein
MYSDEDVLFFSLVADQIALATDDALNFEASQKNGERLQLLLDLSNRVMANLELPELLKEISASIRQVMQCDGVGVILPGTENEFRLYALDFPKSKGLLADKLSLPVEEKASLTQVIRQRHGGQLRGDRRRDTGGLPSSFDRKKSGARRPKPGAPRRCSVHNRRCRIPDAGSESGGDRD